MARESGTEGAVNNTSALHVQQTSKTSSPDRSNIRARRSPHSVRASAQPKEYLGALRCAALGTYGAQARRDASGTSPPPRAAGVCPRRFAQAPPPPRAACAEKATHGSRRKAPSMRS